MRLYMSGAYVYTHGRQAAVVQVVRRALLVRLDTALAPPALPPWKDGGASARQLSRLQPRGYARGEYPSTEKKKQGINSGKRAYNDPLTFTVYIINYRKCRINATVRYHSWIRFFRNLRELYNIFKPFSVTAPQPTKCPTK